MSKFFDEMVEASEVKALIVSKYFSAWARVIGSSPYVTKMGYLDLFSGPGRYKDGSPSTPLLVLEKIINNESFRNKITAVFNDKNPDYARALENEIKSMPGIEKLKYPPVVFSMEVGNDFIELFNKNTLIPTLTFLDPWGYKGLSLELIHALVKDWGSDCIFFFNYNRINAGLLNPKVVEHMNQIFGEERANYLREILPNYSSNDRPAVIVNEMVKALNENGAKYILPFCFLKNNERTSHYLVFVSKHHKGYEIMKDIMAKHSSKFDDGVASFSYIPVRDEQLTFLFEYSRPLDELGDMLLKKYSRKTMTVRDIFEDHNVGTSFTLKNYQEALRRLELAGSIKADPPASNRKIRHGKVTMPDYVKITFP